MRKVMFILGELSDNDVQWLTVAGHKAKVPPGTALIRQGQPIDAMYIILDGRFSVSVARQEHQEITRLGAGEILGEISFIDERPPVATVTAIEPAVVLAIPRRELESKLKQDLAFASRFYRALALFLADRLRSTVGQLGYGQQQPAPEDDDSTELNLTLLDSMHLASGRFDRMLKKLMGS